MTTVEYFSLQQQVEMNASFEALKTAIFKTHIQAREVARTEAAIWILECIEKYSYAYVPQADAYKYMKDGHVKA